MVRNSRRRSLPSAGPRRKFIWARTSGSFAVGAVDDASADLLSAFETAYGAQLIGCTIVRIRGYFIANLLSAASTESSAWGIRVGTEPLADISGPVQLPHADWMAYTLIVLDTGGAAGTDATVQVRHGEVDIKSQRKLEELNETLYLAVSNEIIGVNMQFTYHLSIGVKLP